MRAGGVAAMEARRKGGRMGGAWSVDQLYDLCIVAVGDELCCTGGWVE